MRRIGFFEAFEEEDGVFHTEFHTARFIRFLKRRWHPRLVRNAIIIPKKQ